MVATSYFVNQSYFHTKITNSTRGWPLLGLPTLLTAGERKQGGVQIETDACKSKHKRANRFCTSVYVLISATKRVVVL